MDVDELHAKGRNTIHCQGKRDERKKSVQAEKANRQTSTKDLLELLVWETRMINSTLQTSEIQSSSG